MRSSSSRCAASILGGSAYSFGLNETPKVSRFFGSNPGLIFTTSRKLVARRPAFKERTRLLDTQPPAKAAETGLGREIQKQTGAPSVLVNRMVQEAARGQLQSYEVGEKKPH